jgi:hypothetical protein
MNFIKDHKNCWTVVLDDQVCVFDKTHVNYELLLDDIRSNDTESFLAHLNVGKEIEVWSKGGFVFKDGNLTYLGSEVPESIANIVTDMIEQGFDETPILNFTRRLFSNPSMRAVKELYPWLSHKSMAITPDGHFLAYKSVNIYNGDGFIDVNGRQVKSGDYVDKYTGTVRNNVGDVNTLLRHTVDDNWGVNCSQGYHAGTLKYVKEVYTSNKQIICKIDPANVVSVPLDCECQKLRCCEYTVVSEFKNLKLVEPDNGIEDIDEDDDICDACGNPEDDCECWVDEEDYTEHW